MQVKLFKPEEMNADFWRAFSDMRNAQALYDDPFFDPEFARLLGSLRKDTHIAVGFEQGRSDPSVFWPMHIRPGGWARPIGGPFSDWHGPVVRADAPVDPSQFLSAAGISGFTCFGMPTELTWGHTGHCAGANMTKPSGGWEEFLANQTRLYPKHFKKIRRVQRNLQRDFSEVEHNMDDPSREAFDWLIMRKREQYARTGRHDVLAPDWAHNLIERLRSHQSARLRTQLMTLRANGKIVAAEFNIVSDKIIHGWLTAYEPEFGNYSPGYLLQQAIIREMDHAPQKIYDSGIGLDYYKKFYSNYQLPMSVGVLRADPRPGLPRVLSQGWNSLENGLPGKFGGLMGKLRRRTDQIVLAETTLTGRLGGFVKALKR